MATTASPACIRNHAARDRAWGRYYGRRGLNPCAPVQPPTPAQRRAEYAFRRALHDGAQH